MFEKVNPSHPDKVADRIAGAIVDLAYKMDNNPKIAVEVLIGHGVCHIIAETSVEFNLNDILDIVKRIVGDIKLDFKSFKQDINLANNQKTKPKCGDNGIFKGVPLRESEKELTKIARNIYNEYPFDGKYILDHDKLIICQSNCKEEDLRKEYKNAIINPLGYWTGGINVDSGATNRKLGSDMGSSITGGGLHGKDLTKADVSVNIYCFLKAQELGREYELSCAIGDEYIDSLEYFEIIEIAREFINRIGGFEKFAEWGLF